MIVHVADVQDRQSIPLLRKIGNRQREFGKVHLVDVVEGEPGGEPSMKPKPGGLFARGGATIKSVGAMLLGAAKSALSFLARVEAEAQKEHR